MITDRAEGGVSEAFVLDPLALTVLPPPSVRPWRAQPVHWSQYTLVVVGASARRPWLGYRIASNPEKSWLHLNIWPTSHWLSLSLSLHRHSVLNSSLRNARLLEAGRISASGSPGLTSEWMFPYILWRYGVPNRQIQTNGLNEYNESTQRSTDMINIYHLILDKAR